MPRRADRARSGRMVSSENNTASPASGKKKASSATAALGASDAPPSPSSRTPQWIQARASSTSAPPHFRQCFIANTSRKFLSDRPASAACRRPDAPPVKPRVPAGDSQSGGDAPRLFRAVWSQLLRKANPPVCFCNFLWLYHNLWLIIAAFAGEHFRTPISASIN